MGSGLALCAFAHNARPDPIFLTPSRLRIGAGVGLEDQE